MNFDDIKLKFGFAEMYQIGVLNKEINKIDYLGRFVQFSNEYPNCIDLATDQSQIIGVSSVTSVATSDDPDYWFNKYSYNELCDTYVVNKPIAFGEKKYDSISEKAYIETRKIDPNYEPMLNPEFDSKKDYVKRSLRNEWVRVTLLGKVVVHDDGTCNEGDKCKLYTGSDKDKIGFATKATDKDIKSSSVNTYHVLCRVSKNTIMIFFK